MATKTQVLNHFRSEIGTVEGPGNRTEYAAEAGHANGYPWCATFVVAMFRRAKMKLPSESAYTPTMYNGLKAAGRAIKGPEVGALAFLYFSSMGRIAHVGIVESLRPDGRFVTIEGNTDVAGGRTGGRVMRKVRSRHNWHFAMPVYTVPPPQRFVLRRVLRVGVADGPDVEALQKKVGTKVDGNFGFYTKKAVKLFQEKVGLKADGEVGPATTAKLGWVWGG